ncbi:MAG TPA: hypothetical protein VEY93_03015 [Longimicrobium sp.]|nr:hypothetical protein [Longimicrobium sp.]
MAAGLLLVAACADGLTTPTQTSAGDAGASSTIALPGVTVTVCQFGGTYPYCWDEPNPPPPEPDPGTCTGLNTCGGGGGSDGSSGDGGGGEGGDSPAPTEADLAVDDDAACADIGCRLETPTSQDLTKVNAAIALIRTDIPFCARIAENARIMVARELKIWRNEVLIRDENGRLRPLLGAAPFRYDPAPPGPIMYLYSKSIHPWTIAHEALHGLPLSGPITGSGYHDHDSVTELGMGMDATAKYCAGA